MDANKSWPLGFEFVDIEIIKHTKEDNEESEEKWDCDQCNLFFLSEEKLIHHKKKHVALSEEVVKCKYCNKVLSITEESKESYSNRKCETCEYRCSKCPQRFLRHSSLLNHERNHTSPKKKRAIINNKKDGVNSKADERVSKKRLIEKANSIQTSNAQNKLTDKHSNRLSPYIKKKSQEKSETPLCEQLHFNSSKMLTNNNKRLSGKLSNSITEKNDSPSKQDCSMNNTITDSQAAPQTKDKTVYYRPFSCHICCANFASDNLLLDHIQTHGENAEGFKCKHCGDKFDDIYKMQYHLAICPLAEDDLESSLRKNILLEFPGRKSTDDNSESFESETPVVRKRGRPKKVTVVPTENVDDSVENEVLSPQRTRGSVRKRKTDEPTSPDISPKVTRSSLARRTVKSRLHEEVLLEDDSDNELDNDGVDPLVFKNKSNENLNESFESEEDSRKKVHSCPFPKCGIKFTREKALLCHMRNHDDDFDEALKCHKCDVPFDDLQSLRTHINICRGIKEEKDDDFNEPNSQAYDLADKTFQSFQRSKGTFVCRVCGRAYLTQERLERHKALHRSSNFMCRICKDVFINQNLLDNHFSIEHPTKSPYHCPICQEDFISELFLQIHESEYHNESVNTENVTNISAQNSPKEEFNLQNWSTDIKSNKSEGLNVWCPVCLANFSERETLRTHLRSNHMIKSKSMFICEVCEVEKPTAEMLAYHLEVHSFNVLSVNRFSMLRGCITNNKIGRSVSVNMYSNMVKVKTGSVSDNESKSEFPQKIGKARKRRQFMITAESASEDEVKELPQKLSKILKGRRQVKVVAESANKEVKAELPRRMRRIQKRRVRQVKVTTEPVNDDKVKNKSTVKIINVQEKRTRQTRIKPEKNTEKEEDNEFIERINQLGTRRRNKRIIPNKFKSVQSKLRKPVNSSSNCQTRQTVPLKLKKRVLKMPQKLQRDVHIPKPNENLVSDVAKNRSDADNSSIVTTDVSIDKNIILPAKVKNKVQKTSTYRRKSKRRFLKVSKKVHEVLLDDKIDCDLKYNSSSSGEDGNYVGRKNNENYESNNYNENKSDVETECKTRVSYKYSKKDKLCHKVNMEDSLNDSVNPVITSSLMKEKSEQIKQGLENVLPADIKNNSKLSSSSSRMNETICCSLCSLTFRDQNELLNHVGTHILTVDL